MPTGKINWANLANYTIQPADLELFQTYAKGDTVAQRKASRTIGILSGGVITVVSGLTVKVSAGTGIMPDGTVVTWDDMTATLAQASATFTRIDRIELLNTPTNNTNVLDVNNVSRVLDIINKVTINIVQGTPASSPSAPAQTSTNLSLGLVALGANTTLIPASAISQVPDTSLQVSAMSFAGGGLIRFNPLSALIQYSNNGGLIWQSVGSGGGGGGGGAAWQGVQGNAAQSSLELDDQAFKFAQGNGEQIALFVRVPDNYIPGTPIKLRLAHYGVTGAGAFKFQAQAILIRRNTDALNAVVNAYLSTNGDVIAAGAYVYQEVVYDLSTAGGLINGVTPNPYDIIKIVLTRVTPTATEDVGDVAAIPSSTEVLFA